MKLEIPIIVGFDDMESLLDDLKKLQTYKLFEGDDMVLVDIDDVADVLVKHIKAKEKQPDFDTVAKIDKAHDDGYKQGYLQGKADYEPKTGKWNIYYDDDAPQDGIWLCSVCGYARLVDDISPQRFCPNCGAMMKEGEEHCD